MNLFEYVPLMKEMGTPCAIAGIAILGLFLVIIILKMLGGMRRGGWRQLVRTGATLLAAIASYIIAENMSNGIIGSLDVNSLESLILELEAQMPGAGDAVRDALSNINTELIEYLLLLPATLFIIPILTTVVFLLINLVLKIIRAIVIKIVGFKKAKNNPQRLCGTILAAIEGLIWVVMVTLPISAIGTLATQAFDEAIDRASEADKVSLIEIYDEYILPFTENPAVCFVESIGGEAMSDGIATVKIDGKKTNMRKELLSVTDTVLVNVTKLGEADFMALNEEEKTALGAIVDRLAQSPFMSRIMVEAIGVVPAIYDMGLIPLEFGENFDSVLGELMTFFRSVSPESLNEDINTLKKFYFGFCDSGLISALADGVDLMKFVSDDYNNEKHILTMLNTLSGNPRTKGIVDGMYNLVLNAAFSGSRQPEDGEGNEDTELPDINISEVKDGLNNIVSVNKSDYETHEEYREALANTIDITINDTIGVDLDDQVVSDISDFVDENYSEQLEELTDEEFNELIFEVVDIYSRYQNGEEPEFGDLENIFGEGA